MQKILLTGSNGLLGQKLVKLILEENEYKLIATSRGENRIQSIAGFIYEPLDITNRDDVFSILEKHQPGYVIHTAAMTNVDQCESEREACINLNVNAVQHITDACEKHNIHLIALSTDFIFDGKNGPYDETAPANPISFYGESKLKGEEIVKKATCPWTIARTILVYGITEEMSRSNIILWVKNSLESGKEIHVVNDQWRSPTLAEDLAMGCYLIAKKNATGIFNISGKDVLTPYEMAKKTISFFSLDDKLMHETDGSRFSQPAKRPPKTGFIIEKAIEKLGYAPHSFDEGIAILANQIKNK